MYYTTIPSLPEITVRVLSMESKNAKKSLFCLATVGSLLPFWGPKLDHKECSYSPRLDYMQFFLFGEVFHAS